MRHRVSQVGLYLSGWISFISLCLLSSTQIASLLLHRSPSHHSLHPFFRSYTDAFWTNRMPSQLTPANSSPSVTALNFNALPAQASFRGSSQRHPGTYAKSSAHTSPIRQIATVRRTETRRRTCSAVCFEFLILNAEMGSENKTRRSTTIDYRRQVLVRDECTCSMNHCGSWWGAVIVVSA